METKTDINRLDHNIIFTYIGGSMYLDIPTTYV